jgi:probable F420-dependent oxidoreductase
MHDRRFRFGLACSKGRSRKEFTELARKAESLGYSTLFVPDHFVEHDLAPTIALAHAAAVTDELRVGTFVLGNDYKHPVVCAREMASLDLLSDGRLELGIGAGWMTADYEKAGIPLDRPGIRIARLAEAITIIKGLFAPGPFTFEGEYYRVTELDGMPKPVQRPHPPIIIGGGGKKVLSLAGRQADIVGINANAARGYLDEALEVKSLVEHVDEMVGWVKDAAGDRYPELELQCLFSYCLVGDDIGPGAERIASDVGLPLSEVVKVPTVAIGSVEEIIDEFQARRDRWDISYYVVMADDAEAFAPVVAALAGK